MSTMNVLVGWPLPRDLIIQISGLNEHIKLLNDPDHEIVRPDVWPPFPFPESLLEFLPYVEILFTSRIPRNLQSLAPNLKWVQLLSAGVDEVKRANLEYSDIVFTTSKGVHATPLSEWVIGAMLAMVKKIPQIVEAQRKREYSKFIGGELSGLTAGILGVGSIGLRVAHICKALDMRVIGTRRSIKSSEKDYGPLDELFPPDQLPTVLEQSDFLIICLPGTEETSHLLGENEFNQMKKGSYVINVGRGGIIDEKALLAAIDAGIVAGGVLDVFAEEPLDPDNPLWQESRLLISPHIAGNSFRYEERATKLFLDNIGRYLNDRELINKYDLEKGY